MDTSSKVGILVTGEMNEYKTFGPVLPSYKQKYHTMVIMLIIMVIMLIFHVGFARWRFRHAIFSEANKEYSRLGTETRTPWFIGIQNF